MEGALMGAEKTTYVYIKTPCSNITKFALLSVDASSQQVLWGKDKTLSWRHVSVHMLGWETDAYPQPNSPSLIRTAISVLISQLWLCGVWHLLTCCIFRTIVPLESTMQHYREVCMKFSILNDAWITHMCFWLDCLCIGFGLSHDPRRAL